MPLTVKWVEHWKSTLFSIVHSMPYSSFQGQCWVQIYYGKVWRHRNSKLHIFKTEQDVYKVKSVYTMRWEVPSELHIQKYLRTPSCQNLMFIWPNILNTKNFGTFLHSVSPPFQKGGNPNFENFKKGGTLKKKLGWGRPKGGGGDFQT